MSIAENIKKYRKIKGYTQNDLAKLLNVRPTTISAWEVGRNKPLMDKIEMLSNVLGINKSDIIGDEKIKNDITIIYNQLEPPRQNKVYDFAKQQLDEQNGKSITVGRATAAGNPICGETQDSDEQHLIVNRDEIPRGADEVITISGDSMEPVLPYGSQQFIHYQPTPDTDGQIMIVNIKDEGVTCKKVYREKDKIRLVSINTKYKDMIYPAEDIKCIGKVILK